jgi:5-methylcytosine-specific restriction endonuclease McrA
MKGYKHTEEAKRKMEKYYFKHGQMNPSWRGGVTPTYRLIRTSDRYIDFRMKVLVRDNYTCQNCEKRGGYLEVHHAKAFSKIISDNNIKTVQQALDCNELWDIDNCVVLCKSCHTKTDNYSQHITKSG